MAKNIKEKTAQSNFASLQQGLCTCWKTRKQDSNSYEVFWDESGKLVLNSYIVKTKSSGKRNVLLLSTMRPILGTAKDNLQLKPAIYKLNDYTKGGTDIID